MKEMFN